MPTRIYNAGIWLFYTQRKYYVYYVDHISCIASTLFSRRYKTLMRRKSRGRNRIYSASHSSVKSSQPPLRNAVHV